LKERFSIMDSDDCYSVIQDLSATTDKALIRKLQQAISLWKSALLTPEQALNIAKDENEAQAARL
jgi:ATP-dependent DNA helicase Rep